MDSLRSSWPDTPRAERKKYIEDGPEYVEAAGLKLDDPCSKHAKDEMVVDQMLEDEAEFKAAAEKKEQDASS